MTKKLFLAIGIMLAPAIAHAGAWTQPRGQCQVITTASIYQAAHYFDANGKKRPQPTFYKQEFSPYVEYGLRDGWTVGGQTSVARAFQENAGGAQNSGWNLGDSEFFVRSRLWQRGNYVISLQPGVLAPSPDKSSDRPKIGSDDYSFSLRANAGYSFNLFGNAHYGYISMGYVHRLGLPGDQLKLDATLGLNITPRWQIMPQAFITHTTGAPAMAGFTQSASDDYDLAKLQLSMLYRLNERYTLQLGGYGNMAGKNTGNGQGALLALWASF